MRRFSPEKELKKIQHGNRNKIILFVIFLLVVGVIGYSFALYQVRYSKRIIYTKVADFSKDLKLAVYVDNKKLSSFPSKNDNLVYTKTDCSDSNFIAKWNYSTWKLDIESNLPNKCDVYFETNPKRSNLLSSNTCKSNDKLNECMKQYGSYLTDTKNDDPDNNIRYIGESPNNYVYFNCDDYNNPTASTCEKWRIIGLFNNMQEVGSDGTITAIVNLVKIIRDEALITTQWNSDGTNVWANASLMTTLNEDYYNGTPVNSSKGINTSTRNMIDYIIWGIGIKNNTSKAELFYNIEQAGIKPNLSDIGSTFQDNLWVGKIGLMYPSDYGYAVGLDYRESCLNKSMYSYSVDCYTNNWLYNPNGYQTTMISVGNTSDTIFGVNPTGNVSGSFLAVSRYSLVRPTLYLKPDVKITGGTGTVNDPYTIIP